MNYERKLEEVAQKASYISSLVEADKKTEDEVEITPDMKDAARKMAQNAAPDDPERQTELIPKFLDQMDQIAQQEKESGHEFDGSDWELEDFNVSDLKLTKDEISNLECKKK